ncbi:hypothetical protein B6U84_06520 [Candidatus Bathyarchaeota archaeon ex4484_40]|nr:MAG: hypothetical protein B6U84_06520 [Candidatus Bathyarchaeota archaeon ex4484_40]
MWAVSPWDPDFFSKLDLCEKCGAKLGFDRKARQARCPSCGRWSFLWDADRCSQRSCGPYGVRYVWDEETRTIRCPRCGDADKVSEQMWKDLMDVKTPVRIHLDIADRTFYREGWRTPDWKNWKSECLHDAYRRLNNIFDRGTPKFYAYERERNCWNAYESALNDMYMVARANGDRAACWVIMRVLENAWFRIYGYAGNAALEGLLDPFTWSQGGREGST